MRRFILVLMLWPCLAMGQSLVEIEQQLAGLGYGVGTVDGIADANTRNAVVDFQYGFGFDATGQLTQEQVTALARAYQIMQVSTPLVVAETRHYDVTTDQRFLGWGFPEPSRMLYASGPHYLSERLRPRGNSHNLKLSTAMTKPLRDANADRQQLFQEQAVALAQSSGDRLMQALVLLSMWEDAPEIYGDIEAAMRFVLRSAEVAPTEPAYAGFLGQAMHRRLRGGYACEQPARASVFGDVSVAAVTLAASSGADIFVQGYILETAIRCVQPEAREALLQQRLALAAQVSEVAQAAVIRDLARETYAQGKYEKTARSYAKLHDWTLTPAAQAYDEVNFRSLLESSDTVAMHAVGLTVRARARALAAMERIERMPVVTTDASRAEQGGYVYNLYETSQMFMEIDQVDLIRRLSAFLNSEAFAPNRGWFLFDAKANPWEGALIGLREARRAEEHQKVYDLGAAVLPAVLADQSFADALEISLMQAEAAVIIGAFEDAESALVRAVSLAQSLDVLPSVTTRVAAVRGALNLSRVARAGAGALIVEQLARFYGSDCKGAPLRAGASYWPFPLLDYAAFRDDPALGDALAERDILVRMMTCRPDVEIHGAELTAFCAVAALAGRKDVVDYVLHAPRQDVVHDDGLAGWEDCAIGLAHGERFGWFQVDIPPSETGPGFENLRFIMMSPTDRKQAVASAPQTDEHLWYWETDWRRLEADLPPARRKERLTDFYNAFGGSFGNMGPQDEDYADALSKAVAFERIGLLNLAEAFYHVSYRGEQFDFDAETETRLVRDLLRPDAIRHRLSFARLYRKQGRPDRAYQAIGPLAELAVARRTSDADPLPGTAEQWAQRLEPLFTAYLALQFEGLAAGPNYPALFAMQQYLQLAGSTASLSVLEQRLNSAAPEAARQYQDTLRALRSALNAPEQNGGRISELNQRLQAAAAGLPKEDAARLSHQIGVTQDLRRVVAALRMADAAMLVATQLDDRLVLTYVDGTGARARTLALGEEAMAARVTAFRRGVIESSEQLDLFDTRRAGQLYDDLIGWGYAGQGAPPTELRLVLSGPLATLPFAALKRGEAWLGATTVLRAAPSVARAATGLRQPEPARGFVGVGDPNLTQGDLSARKDLLGTNAGLPELPETAAELAFMALAFGGNPTTDVFTRDQASEVQLRRLNQTDRLAEAGILALATHGLLSRETGSLGAAGLLLSLPQAPGSDGVLSAPEIYNYRIGADLVILSACNTGTPGAGAGLSDLASAFLYAGAGSLLLTHWEIDSGAGVELMKRVATSQRNGAAGDFSKSVQQAVAGLLQDPALARFHHPRFWASHFILG